jgi:hypothetical protein
MRLQRVSANSFADQAPSCLQNWFPAPPPSLRPTTNRTARLHSPAGYFSHQRDSEKYPLKIHYFIVDISRYLKLKFTPLAHPPPRTPHRTHDARPTAYPPAQETGASCFDRFKQGVRSKVRNRTTNGNDLNPRSRVEIDFQLVDLCFPQQAENKRQW